MVTMVKFFGAIVLLFGCGVASAFDVARDGQAACVIVVPEKASQPEQHAARELAEHLRAVTGGTFDIKVESNVAADAPQILVGPSKRARQLVSDVAWKELGADGIVIKTIGRQLVLSGAPGATRGTLYAVYTFLEDHVGCRWWTSTESDFPRKPTLSLDSLDATYAPKLRYREAYYRDATQGAMPHAVRLKLNGRHNNIPAEWGGHYTLIGWCHTFYSLIPPGEHFAKHPEWFSEIDGKRKVDGGQLCLSNDAMRAELTRRVLAQIATNPAAGMVSVSQNDSHGACQCKDCRAIEAEEGSHSGPLIRFVNAVAADVKKQYPDFLVETLAYQYTRKPPKKTKPADNVLVRLCSIEANFAHPLSAESNRSFGDDLRGWAAIAPKLFIWNYVTNFSNYLQPHPNMGPFADDLRFFIDHNVVGVFEQGDYYNEAGDFLQLRAWLLAHLMWDPSRDPLALRRDFLEGYYGAAATHLAKYLDLMAEPTKSATFRLPTYIGNASFISTEALEKSTALFDAAQKAVASDPTRAARVRRERLAIEQVRLQRYDFPGRLAELKRNAGDDAARAALAKEYGAMVEAYIAACRDFGVRNLSEMQGFDSYAPALRMRADRFIPPTLPAPGAALPKDTFDLQEDRFYLYRRPELADLVDDAKASNGKAARMSGHHSHWAIQLHIDENVPPVGKGPWKCYVVARVDAKTKSAGGAFQFGLHDPNGHIYVARESINLDIAGDGEYRVYGLYVPKLKPGMYFWVAPVGNSNVESIFVDRVFITRDPIR